MFRNIQIQNDKIGAAATIIVERFLENKIVMSYKTAKLSYLAIASNTLNFKSNNTTKRDIDAFDYLQSEFKFDSKLIHDMFIYKSQFSDIKKHFFPETRFNKNIINYTQIEMV
jgi:inorganic pyrophosphatase/exopolyphosphatase